MKGFFCISNSANDHTDHGNLVFSDISEEVSYRAGRGDPSKKLLQLNQHEKLGFWNLFLESDTVDFVVFNQILSSLSPRQAKIIFTDMDMNQDGLINDVDVEIGLSKCHRSTEMRKLKKALEDIGKGISEPCSCGWYVIVTPTAIVREGQDKRTPLVAQLPSGTNVFVERVVHQRALISCVRRVNEDLDRMEGWISCIGSKGYPLIKKVKTQNIHAKQEVRLCDTSTHMDANYFNEDLKDPYDINHANRILYQQQLLKASARFGFWNERTLVLTTQFLRYYVGKVNPLLFDDDFRNQRRNAAHKYQAEHIAGEMALDDIAHIDVTHSGNQFTIRSIHGDIWQFQTSKALTWIEVIEEAREGHFPPLPNPTKWKKIRNHFISSRRSHRSMLMEQLQECRSDSLEDQFIETTEGTIGAGLTSSMELPDESLIIGDDDTNPDFIPGSGLWADFFPSNLQPQFQAHFQCSTRDELAEKMEESFQPNFRMSLFRYLVYNYCQLSLPISQQYYVQAMLRDIPIERWLKFVRKPVQSLNYFPRIIPQVCQCLIAEINRIKPLSSEEREALHNKLEMISSLEIVSTFERPRRGLTWILTKKEEWVSVLIEDLKQLVEFSSDVIEALRQSMSHLLLHRIQEIVINSTTCEILLLLDESRNQTQQLENYQNAQQLELNYFISASLVHPLCETLGIPVSHESDINRLGKMLLQLPYLKLVNLLQIVKTQPLDHITPAKDWQQDLEFSWLSTEEIQPGS